MPSSGTHGHWLRQDSSQPGTPPGTARLGVRAHVVLSSDGSRPSPVGPRAAPLPAHGPRPSGLARGHRSPLGSHSPMSGHRPHRRAVFFDDFPFLKPLMALFSCIFSLMIFLEPLHSVFLHVCFDDFSLLQPLHGRQMLGLPQSLALFCNLKFFFFFGDGVSLSCPDWMEWQ